MNARAEPGLTITVQWDATQYTITLDSVYPGMATNLRVLIQELRITKVGEFELAPDAPPETVITAYVSLMLCSLYLAQLEITDLAMKTREQFLQTFGTQFERDLFALIADIANASRTVDVVALVGRFVGLLKKRARGNPPAPVPATPARANTAGASPGSAQGYP